MGWCLIVSDCVCPPSAQSQLRHFSESSAVPQYFFFSKCAWGDITRFSFNKMHLLLGQVSEYLTMLPEQKHESQVTICKALISKQSFSPLAKLFNAMNDHSLPTTIHSSNISQDMSLWLHWSYSDRQLGGQTVVLIIGDRDTAGQRDLEMLAWQCGKVITTALSASSL